MRPGRAADHSPPSSAPVMEEYSYTSTHLLGHTGPVTGSLCFTVLAVLRPMVLEMQVFWHVTSCRDGRSHKLFARSWRFNLCIPCLFSVLFPFLLFLYTVTSTVPPSRNAQIPGARLRWCVMFVRLQYGTCLMASFLRVGC